MSVGVSPPARLSKWKKRSSIRLIDLCGALWECEWGLWALESRTEMSYQSNREECNDMWGGYRG